MHFSTACAVGCILSPLRGFSGCDSNQGVPSGVAALTLSERFYELVLREISDVRNDLFDCAVRESDF